MHYLHYGTISTSSDFEYLFASVKQAEAKQAEANYPYH